MEYQNGARLMEALSLLRFIRDLLPPQMPIPLCECIMLKALSSGEQNGRMGSRMSELSAQTHMALPAVSRMLRSFEQRGWVVRRIDNEDRRSVYIRLTQEGKRQIEEFGRLLYSYVEETAQRFGKENIDALESLIQQLVSLIPEHTVPAGKKR